MAVFQVGRIHGFCVPSLLSYNNQWVSQFNCSRNKTGKIFVPVNVPDKKNELFRESVFFGHPAKESRICDRLENWICRQIYQAETGMRDSGQTKNGLYGGMGIGNHPGDTEK